MIDKLPAGDRDNHGVYNGPRLDDIVAKVNEVVEAWNRRENARVVDAATELLVKMSMIPTGIPLAVVHPHPDGELVIEHLVTSGQALVEGDKLVLTDDGRVQGLAILESIRVA